MIVYMYYNFKDTLILQFHPYQWYYDNPFLPGFRPTAAVIFQVCWLAIHSTGSLSIAHALMQGWSTSIHLCKEGIGSTGR